MNDRGKQLTILHINTEKTFRGGEIQTLRLAEALQKKGHHNHLIVQPHSRLAQLAKESSFSASEVAMRGELDLFAVRRIRKIVRELSPDMIHAHTPHAAMLGLISRGKSATPGIVFSRRVTFPIRSRHKYKKVDAILAVSETVKAHLLKQGFPPEKVFVAESGTDFSVLDSGFSRELARRALAIEGDPFIIGNISYFEEKKGQHLLIQAFANFVKPHHRSKLLLVGGGPALKKCKALCRELGSSEHIIFTGERRDVENIYPAMDVFFLPSLHSEGWSGVLREAMGLGLPVIAVDQPVIEEQVGQAGLLVSEQIATWSTAMEQLHTNPLFASQLGKSARIQARKFTIEAMADKTEACYRAVLSR